MMFAMVTAVVHWSLEINWSVLHHGLTNHAVVVDQMVMLVYQPIWIGLLKTVTLLLFKTLKLCKYRNKSE